jgi:chloramphenicol 3-O-phosphotransferase
VTLVLLYGPPAAGKLTVARSLAALTGFKLFDNHASIDLALRFFAFGSAAFGKVVNGVRALVLDAAAEAGVSLIFTYVYAHPQDDAYLEAVMAGVEEHGGHVALVQLTAPTEALLARVADPSRQLTGKLKTAADLHRVLETYDVFTPYGGREHLTLDSSAASPAALARTIAERYRLPLLEVT